MPGAASILLLLFQTIHVRKADRSKNSGNLSNVYFIIQHSTTSLFCDYWISIGHVSNMANSILIAQLYHQIWRIEIHAQADGQGPDDHGSTPWTTQGNLMSNNLTGPVSEISIPCIKKACSPIVILTVISNQSFPREYISGCIRTYLRSGKFLSIRKVLCHA